MTGRALAIPQDDIEALGPAMAALTQLQRNFVSAYLAHPNWTPGQCIAEAGYSIPVDPKSTYLRKQGSVLMHDERIIAAINEEGSKRLRGGGVIGINGVLQIALNTAHKDHLKACLALMDRTGFHAMSEHKVTVDDKRPQTKQEMVDRVKELAQELGLGPDAVKQMTGEDVVEGEFTVVDSVDEQISKEVEDL